MRISIVAAGFVVLSACSAGDSDSGTVVDPVQDCIDTYSVASGYGHGGADLGALEAECNADGGTGCTAADFFTVDAATCIAEQVHAFDRGISDYKANLVYHSGDKTVRWNIDNTQFDQPGHSGGDYIALHATDGSLLDVGNWEAIQ